MISQSNVVPEAPLGSQAIAPATMSVPRPFYWSVLREVWENRSIYIAPLAVAAVILFGFLISTITLPSRMRTLDPAKLRTTIEMPYSVTAFLILLTAFIVGVFYCLDALYGERRDRSILFWKSLPVSDLTVVLSKASIPLIVLPLIVFAITVSVQLTMLLLSTVVLMGNGSSLATLWANLPLFQMQLAFLYSLFAISLWHAPIYGWLLVVSVWARRAPILWAILPWFAIGIFEKIAFNTSHFGTWVRYRLIGWFTQALNIHPRGSAPMDPLLSLAPGKFLSTPGLWLGLIVATAFLAAAVRLRRYREPI